MALKIHPPLPLSPFSSPSLPSNLCTLKTLTLTLRNRIRISKSQESARKSHFPSISAALPPLDLTEDNVRQVLIDARTEFAQIFDTSVGMTGEAELAEMDGPFVKLTLRGRFWHTRSMVLARLGNYLKKRIPEILEVEIEDEKQLDDSPENF
ncbi:uncharacterized protein LOC143856450 [Tasmannia lanceolata]|uniref:uncharacterized protein LOC143856450 n=1 Tax=Tasmannia lanceolata TaxID=3420 RepID=UPI0040646F45